MTAVNLSQPDVTLLLDLEGAIRKATLSTAIGGEGVEAWLGLPWTDTIRDPISDRVREMVDDARTTGVSAFREITQRFPSGLELPMEYTMVRLGGEAGLIAIGKNIQAVTELQSQLVAAQHAREHEYWKVRELQNRYQLLFDASNDPVVLIDPETMQIVEANPAAIRTVGLTPGRELIGELAPRERESFRTMLARVREQGRTPGVLVHLGATQTAWMVRAVLTASGHGPVFVLQFAPALAAIRSNAPNGRANGRPNVEILMQRLPDAFVITDAKGKILRTNHAFLDLTQVGGEGTVIGESLGRWLSQPGADLAVLIGILQQQQTVRAFTTTLYGELGSETAVEISAVSEAEARSSAIGVLIRDVSRRLPMPANTEHLTASLAPISSRVGETALVELVRDTTDAVEQHYIKLALDRTLGNRTAAAELLGLSRQSLYSKLNRYGIDKRTDYAAD